MRTTAKYTLFLGFTFSSIAASVVLRYGTGFGTMTAVLYLYGIACVLGGLFGYRKAALKHRDGRHDPSLREVAGLDALRERLGDDTWTVETEDGRFEAKEVSLSEKLVSVERERDGRTVGVSYPRQDVVACRR
ncbi:MAG: hypothetical protein SV186_06480 [Candidatus Nanohaloarchaea archaeon]|nr:hypothetical protein [Candidatus Nanohaloarchaea archaeon]